MQINLEGLLKNNIQEYKDLKDLSKKSKIILYFYPKDNTPGCTNQAVDFNDYLDEFSKMGIEIIGCSSDSIDSHKKFQEKHDLNFILLSDPKMNLINDFKVFGEKKNYGKVFMGLIRSSFLIDVNSGQVLREWRNVRAKNHAQKLLKDLS
jgi:peroxiredoxin Q/BCP